MLANVAVTVEKVTAKKNIVSASMQGSLVERSANVWVVRIVRSKHTKVGQWSQRKASWTGLLNPSSIDDLFLSKCLFLVVN